MQQQHFHFVTGRLAQHALEAVVPVLAKQVGFAYSIDVLPITVAALMSPAWIAKHVQVPASASRLIIPGYCEGDLEPLVRVANLPVDVGPRDLRQLPAYFSREPAPLDYGDFDLQIIAEINNCPRLSLQEILRQAAALEQDGADVIDVGCEPGYVWPAVGETVHALRDAGHRVSVDSFQPQEIAAAVRAGAELVLSVNSSNRDAAVDWGVEVVAIPDDPKSLAGLDATLEFLAKSGVALRVDPILEPISFGFAESLGRFLSVRRRYPNVEMMMGTGNLTELTDVDSAGVNTLLLGFCQELGIRSILTTQVINWARSCVQECDRARRLMFHAINNRVLPKHLEPELLMLRDESLWETPVQQIAQLAADVRDSNYRIFTAEDEIHLVGRQLHLRDADPFDLMRQLLLHHADAEADIEDASSRSAVADKLDRGGNVVAGSSTAGNSDPLTRELDPGHAFYLGYEMCKARTALTLGKTYEQDESLNWGLATRSEKRHYLKKKQR